MLLNYSYELPFGRGRQFMNSSDHWGGKILNGFVGGWSFAGVTTYGPKGTPVLLHWCRWRKHRPRCCNSLGFGSRHQSRALYRLLQGADRRRRQLRPRKRRAGRAEPKRVRPDSGLHTQQLTLRVPQHIRNPGFFTTDATLLKKFHFSEVESRYLEARIEALNIFNHANFNDIDNDPDSSTFGGIKGKTGQRLMQIGLRLFF